MIYILLRFRLSPLPCIAYMLQLAICKISKLEQLKKKAKRKVEGFLSVNNIIFGEDFISIPRILDNLGSAFSNRIIWMKPKESYSGLVPTVQ